MPSLSELADAVGGRVDGPADLELSGVAPLDRAGPGDLTFAKDRRHLERLPGSRAGAVLCREGDAVDRPAIRVTNPRLAAARAAALLMPPRPLEAGVHALAVVAPGARVAASAEVGPFVVVGAGAVVGERVVLGPHVVVAADCRVGDDTVLEAHVVLYPRTTIGRRCEIHAGAVLGSPGFGYEMTEDGPVGFPQNGSVVVGDDVRIGANTTVDRSTFGSTVLGDRVKIDNLVQVGHNVTIGDGVIICAQTGIGGGAVLEERSVVGPQGALAPDATLGRETILGARGALQSHGRLDGPGQVFMGTPPIPIEDWKRWVVLRRRLKRRTGRLRL